jgi:hypothetical protein
MPAYTTVRFQFGKESRGALVRSFYKAFTSEGLAFSRVHAWGCRPDLTLEEIIEWNQQKLDEDFELGYDEDVSHDYRQVLLADHPFSECRVYILNGRLSFSFHCIVPESEISSHNCAPLVRVADRVWSTLPVKSIDSFGECDGEYFWPVARLFAYTDRLTPDMAPERFVVEPLRRGYRLNLKKTAGKPGDDLAPGTQNSILKQAGLK